MTLKDEIEFFLAERAVLAEQVRGMNERLSRGEMVPMTSPPIAPAERGEELLRAVAGELDSLDAVWQAARDLVWHRTEAGGAVLMLRDSQPALDRLNHALEARMNREAGPVA